jgi:ABC-2 type transport system permease protein
VREPLGVLGTVLPVLLFVGLGRVLGSRMRGRPGGVPPGIATDVPIFVSLWIAIGAVLSLVTIIAIYREGGILKRLRATPLRPHTILTAHVLVKLLSTAITVAAMMLAGRRYYPVDAAVPVVSFALAVLFSTMSVLSLGFLIASVVPTARFAQPVGSLLLYPMLAVSGLFVPFASLPTALRLVARALPLPYAVSLLRGIWRGEGWLAHLPDAAMLLVMGLVYAALSSRLFRWE